MSGSCVRCRGLKSIRLDRTVYYIDKICGMGDVLDGERADCMAARGGPSCYVQFAIHTCRTSSAVVSVRYNDPI